MATMTEPQVKTLVQYRSEGVLPIFCLDYPPAITRTYTIMHHLHQAIPPSLRYFTRNLTSGSFNFALRHCCSLSGCIFSYNDTATTEIYALPLHHAVPI